MMPYDTDFPSSAEVYAAAAARDAAYASAAYASAAYYDSSVKFADNRKLIFHGDIPIDGSYIINNNLSITFSKKPKLIHRFFTKLLLGWVWVDK